MIRRTLSELAEGAAESYSYEYHQNGFYILINVWDDDEYLPHNWKHLKEMVNGKMTYFKSDDWWE